MDKDIVERLRKRAEEDRKCAANSAVIVDLLAPEMAKFEGRSPHNLYAVRMAVEHESSVKRDTQYATELEEAAAEILALRERLAEVEGALGECRNRLLTAAIAGGTSEEYAKIAVQCYDDLLARTILQPSTKESGE